MTKQAKAVCWPRRIARWVLTILILIIVSAMIGWIFNKSTAALNHDTAPADLGRGFLHGALMPLALPNLAVGRDVAIYATHNTGVRYKLGYTLGVNACGAIFFGMFYWRLNRIRRGRSDDALMLPSAPGSSTAKSS